MAVSWENVTAAIENCKACSLCKSATHKVMGQGDKNAPLMFIGEGPGEQEDFQGLAFVGPAGQLLTKMLAAIGLERERVYIANIVKCRPPNNRQPAPEEAAACLPYLRAQVALIRPKVIVLLGATAAQNTLGSHIRITRDRGKWAESKGVFMLPTYHPSALLRDESKKKDAWQDMRLLKEKLIELGLYSDIYKGD